MANNGAACNEDKCLSPPVIGSKSDLRHNNRRFGSSLFQSPCRTVDKRKAGFNTDRCFVAAADDIF